MFKLLLNNIVKCIFLIGVLWTIFAAVSTPIQKAESENLRSDELGTIYLGDAHRSEFFTFGLWESQAAEDSYNKALEQFNAFLYQHPNDRSSLTNRAGTYLGLGRYDDALKDYNLILEIEPNDPYARLGIANVYEQMGEIDIALEKYDQAIDHMESSAHWNTFWPEEIENVKKRRNRLKARSQE